MDKKSKVQALLSAAQASLFSHLIQVSQNRVQSDSYLGWLPFPQQLAPISQKALSKSNFLSPSGNFQDSSRSIQHRGQFQIHSFIQGEIQTKIYSQNNGLPAKIPYCKGKVKTSTPPSQQLQFSFEEDFENQAIPMPKVLRRNKTRISRNNPQHPNFKPKPARFIIPDPLSQSFKSQKPVSKHLYGEVFSTTYSQGGDGFALHPGDIVTIVQFMGEYGMIECRWQGLQGLFPSDKIKVLTKPNEGMTSSLYTLATSSLFHLSSSKMMKRRAK